MIFVDSREDIPIANAVKVEGLEAQTGADFMVSRLSAPCKTKSLLMKHLNSGAVLCQLKITEDLAASVGDRLNDSLARMRSVTTRPACRMLLFIGALGMNSEGSATINGHRTRRNVSFATIEGAGIGWIARGGTMPFPLPRIEMLDGWAHAMERRLAEYAAEPVKHVFSQQEMPDELEGELQIPVRVKDSRRVLIGFRGLGPKLVNRVWEYCGHDFKACLAFLTDLSSVGKVEDISVKTICSIRAQCGLGEGDGYIGWSRDAVDAPETVAPKRVPNAATIAKDTQDLFGKKRNEARK